MAMTFTIATAAREALSAVIAMRLVREKAEDDAKTKAYEEVCLRGIYYRGGGRGANVQAEAAKTRGTPVTKESYNKWRDAFLKEMSSKRVKDEEDRVRALPSREREEVKRRLARPSGESRSECGHRDGEVGYLSNRERRARQGRSRERGDFDEGWRRRGTATRQGNDGTSKIKAA